MAGERDAAPASVTTILAALDPTDALERWAATRGAALHAFAQRLVAGDDPDEVD